MIMDYALAIDIGASSGRGLLGHFNDDGSLLTEEIHRFKTKRYEKNGTVYWNSKDLFHQILLSLKKCKEIGKIPSKIGIDTFGVDYALLDEGDSIIDDVISYRDNRGEKAKRLFLTPREVYGFTGVYPHGFNTVYQLYDDTLTGRIEKAKTLLMLPSYLAFLLTGKKCNEFSDLSTCGLIDTRTGEFSKDLLSKIGLGESLFDHVVEAGTMIGRLKENIAKEIGYNLDVMACYSHDTASSFFGSMAQNDELLLSSGTWSLLGCYLDKPVISSRAFELGYSNEMNNKGNIRFLKNIMGMWIINRIKEERGDEEDFPTIVALASENSSFPYCFDVNDESLMNPESMVASVTSLLELAGNKRPLKIGELYYSVYHSLALEYKKSIDSIGALTGKRYQTIRVFGGGSLNGYLNELLAKESDLRLILGPSEATGEGNIRSIQ